MLFKNYKRKNVRVVSNGGLNTALFLAGQSREVPEHMEEACLSAGLVPLEEVADFDQRVADEQKAIAVEQEAQEAQEAELLAEKAENVRIAAEKAEKEAALKRSQSAAKAAATRKANKDKKLN
jgi:hypothetical protein